MPLSTADEIYDVDYAHANAIQLQLGPGKDTVIFDFGVNSGVSRSIKFSQRIVGTSQDGIMGPVTLAAINAYDPANFINQLCTARLEVLRGLGTWDHFGAGWSARVADLRTYSLNLASTKRQGSDRGAR